MTENNKGCGCGNNHDGNHNHDEALQEVEMLRLTLDDDTQMECYVLNNFEVKDKEYIALLPKGSEQVMLYEYDETPAGPQLTVIPDDDFDDVAKKFQELEDDYEEE